MIISFAQPTWADNLQLRTQVECLCLLQRGCDLSRPQAFVFTRQVQGQAPRHFALYSTPDHTGIYEIQSPVLSAGESINHQMRLIHLGEGPNSHFHLVQYDHQGLIRHNSRLRTSPESLSEELENWQQARELQDILHANGIPIERGRWEPGTWLIRQSDRVGLLRAQGIAEEGLTLNEVLRRFDDETRPPYVEQARYFERRHGEYFSQCAHSREGLCQFGATEFLATREATNPQSMHAWQNHFNRRFAVHWAALEGPAPSACRYYHGEETIHMVDPRSRYNDNYAGDTSTF
jgi:hypothetical protein